MIDVFTNKVSIEDSVEEWNVEAAVNENGDTVRFNGLDRAGASQLAMFIGQAVDIDHERMTPREIGPITLTNTLSDGSKTYDIDLMVDSAGNCVLFYCIDEFHAAKLIDAINACGDYEMN